MAESSNSLSPLRRDWLAAGMLMTLAMNCFMSRIVSSGAASTVMVFPVGVTTLSSTDPAGEAGRVLSVDELAQSPAALQRHYGQHDGTDGPMTEILGSRQNNTFMTYPPGTWFEWKSQVLFWFERAAQHLKFYVPAALILFGAWLVWQRRPGKYAARQFSRSPGKVKG